MSSPRGAPARPRPYLLVGGGRMARHMGHYLDLLDIPWRGWRRGEAPRALTEAARGVHAVLLLVSDHAIAQVARDHHVRLGSAPRVHFSGSARVAGVQCCHPLGSFGLSLHPEELYRRIVFVCDPGPLSFRHLFPHLPNPSATLRPGLRPRYHAAAVLGGNFTALLWKKAMEELTGMGLPEEAGRTYMETVFHGMLEDLDGSLTGPLVRGDGGTIRDNLRALEGDPFAHVYRAFVNASGLEAPE